MGIPPEVLPRIFDPFFTTKEVGKGTGLGLSIVHSVVTRSQGFIEIESAVGQGTAFHVYLPLVEGASPKFTQQVRRAAGRGSGRVLVVDDLDLIRDFSKAFLCAAGFEFVVASDGLEAFNLLENQGKGPSVNLVLTDYNMPCMTGVELVQEAVVRWPHLRFILTSGYLEEEERQKLDGFSQVQCLNKPYGTREAVDLILEMLADDFSGKA